MYLFLASEAAFQDAPVWQAVATVLESRRKDVIILSGIYEYVLRAKQCYLIFVFFSLPKGDGRMVQMGACAQRLLPTLLPSSVTSLMRAIVCIVKSAGRGPGTLALGVVIVTLCISFVAMMSLSISVTVVVRHAVLLGARSFASVVARRAIVRSERLASLFALTPISFSFGPRSFFMASASIDKAISFLAFSLNAKSPEARIETKSAVKGALSDLSPASCFRQYDGAKGPYRRIPRRLCEVP